MTLEVLFKNPIDPSFLSQAVYFGLSFNAPLQKKNYQDLEKFFLKATRNLSNSRTAEGLICWLKAYGHLLSPSKIRRLIKAGEDYDKAVFGAFVDCLVEDCANGHQFKILQTFSVKKKSKALLYPSPSVAVPNRYFKKYNLIAHSYKCDQNKFLLPKKNVYQSCVELRNRALFGSTVNADVASYLHYNPEATAYKISKETFHHKASVFKVFSDVKEAA